GITLAHNPATTVTLGSSTLNPGASTTWSATYQPAAISSGDGTIPGRFFFDDTIRVTAATPSVGPPLTPVAGCRTPMIWPAPPPAARSPRQIRASVPRSGQHQPWKSHSRGGKSLLPPHHFGREMRSPLPADSRAALRGD